MAKIQTIYSEALPTTTAGQAKSMSSERAQTLAIDPNRMSVRKWQALGNVGDVAKDWGNKIIEARDAYEINKAKIDADQKYKQLLEHMETPDFKKEHSWGEYNDYFSDKSKEIQRTVGEGFRGTPAARRKALDLMLKDIHGTNETRVSGMSRLGEVSEIQSSIPKTLEYWSRRVSAAARVKDPKTGKTGDPKVVVDGMNSARAYLDSMLKAGVITGMQHDAYIENFQAGVNDVVHKERIFDAAANTNKAAAVGQLRQLVKDYSEPRDDLDEDQRITYKHMAQQALATKMREEKQVDHFAKYRLEEARRNSLALAKETGKGDMLSFDRFKDVYGLKGNKAQAEYAEYKDNYRFSNQHHTVMNWVDGVAPSLYREALSSPEVLKTLTGIGNVQPHDAVKISEDAKTRANQNENMLITDPAKFAKERAHKPDGFKDLPTDMKFDFLINEQTARGVGEKDASLLTVDEAKRNVSTLTSASPDDAIEAITAMKESYGSKHFSNVMRDMQRQKLPVAYELVARMDPSPTGDRGLMEEILKANSLNTQEWSKTMGEDAQIMRAKVNDQINTLFKGGGFEDALTNSASTVDDIKKVGDLKVLMGNLALYRMQTQGTPLHETSNATESAVRDVMNQYKVVPNKKDRFFGFGQDPRYQRFMIPKAWAEKIERVKPVGDALEYARDKLIDKELNTTLAAMQAKNIARGYEPFSEEDLSAAREAFIRESYWATDNAEEGLYLMTDNGLRLSTSYDQILNWTRTEGTTE